MKRIVLTALVFGISGFIYAQEAGGHAASSPPPLPPKPWLKRAPVPSQWVVSYSGKSKELKEPAQPKASPSQTPVDLTARKTVAVNKATNLLVEVTTRQSGAIVSRWKASGLFLTQVGSGGNWFASSGPQNGFNETDYTNCDFPGFDWISEKNYAGVKKIGSAQCLVFHDKVVTMDPKELSLIQTEMQQAINDWEIKQEERKANPSSSATNEDPPPRKFNIDDYKMDTVAVIDSATGLPVMLSYMTDTGNETRTYQFYPAPATPPSLPPGAQAIVTAQQDRLKRLSRPAAIP